MGVGDGIAIYFATSGIDAHKGNVGGAGSLVMFDTEIWHIAADTERRIYCGAIDNRVAIYPERGKEYGAFVKVPSDLFHFMQNVGGITLDELRDNPVSLFLSQEGDLWYFGLCAGEEGVDLWAYKSLPVWAARHV